MRKRRRGGPVQQAENHDRLAAQPAVRPVRITLPTAAVLRQMLENNSEEA